LKVRIGNEIKEYTSIWWNENNELQMIDQRQLPFSFEVYTAKTIDDVCYAIKEMVVRGAPLIGITGAYGLVLHASNFSRDDRGAFDREMQQGFQKLIQTRPTAVDLFNIQARMIKLLNSDQSVKDLQNQFFNYANQIKDEIVAECRKIGEIGNELITKDHTKIMTICNAGALATVDIGTALAPIRKAHQENKKLVVYVPETRPRIQGGRLTAWELENEGIDHLIIADSAMGYCIKEGLIDLVITGADRIGFNGDTANKIGTYSLSLLCKENNIPFYVAAPASTFDLVSSGESFVIEFRNEIEIKTALSIIDSNDKKPVRRIIHNINSKSYNPAFDITPHKNISGFITPKGLITPPFEKKIKEFFGK
jgi:S-methyl-5-thioribose-1-phosphate isomerase